MQVLHIVLLAAAYVAAAKLGLAMAFDVAQITAIWPPTGIALAAVLLLGYRVWPGIALGAFIANITTNEPLGTALGITLGNTLEALAGAWMLRRAGFNPQLSRLHDVLALLLCSALLSTTISATIGTASLCMGGVQPWEAYNELWWLWWLGDATGALLVAPVLLVWCGKPHALHRRDIVEAVTTTSALIALSLIIFGITQVNSQVFLYIIFPFIIWAAFRFGQYGTTWLTLIASAVAIWATLHGLGPFSGMPVGTSLILLQIFMGIVALTGLLLSAAINEHRETAEMQSRLAAIVESSNDAIIGKDMDGNINFWNAAAERLFGYSAAEIIGQPIARIIPAAVNEPDAIARSRLGGHYETIGLAKSGNRLDLSIVISSIRDAGGRIIGTSKVVRDIGERKWAEEVLRESEARFRLMADTAPVLIWMSGVDKKCNYFNKSWLDFTGRSMEQEMGDGWAEGVHPEDLSRCLETYITAFDARRPFEMEYRLRRHDGEYRWILDSGSPRFTSANQFAGYIGSCIDINARKEGEEALQLADRRKDEFLAMLAHELRNPLAPIAGVVNVLQRSDVSAPRKEEAYDIITRQVDHMVHLVDDLLDISRISHGKITLQKQRVSLNEAITSAVETTRPLIDSYTHTLSVSPLPEPVWLDADPTRLSQIFANLLNNAAKYTPPGGKIHVSAEADSASVTIRIRDTGIGIPSAMTGKIFDMFTQVDTSIERAHGGLGIGLTLVKNLVEMHGGSVRAASAGAGCGSEFIVRLPRAEPGVAEPSIPLVEVKTSAAPLRVLIVDDGEMLAKTQSWMLEALGHEARVAHNGKDALALAPEYVPDVVILDIGLPGMNGYDVCRELRKLSALAHCTFIAQTGWGQPEHRQRSKEAGFHHHLVKPVDIEVLEGLLKSLSERAAA